jgi:hypothetical protein
MAKEIEARKEDQVHIGIKRNRGHTRQFESVRHVLFIMPRSCCNRLFTRGPLTGIKAR